MAHCMCEGVREDSRHGTGNVDIQVGLCIILLECVFVITWALRWGVNPCRKIQLLGISHPVVGIIISGTEGAPGYGTHPRP